MNIAEENERPVRTTIFNVPGFQGLPKRVKRMLVATEAHLFEQPTARLAEGSDVWEAEPDDALETLLTNWREALSSGREGGLELAVVEARG